MKIKLIALFAVLFVACSALHFVEPTAAAQKGYKIDHGTKYFYDGQTGYQKVTWKTYWYTKNVRKVVRKYYVKENGKYIFSYTDTATLQKVSKTKMKIKLQNEPLGPSTYTYYVKTKLSTRWYYWKVYRPNIQNG
jgi:hypothetical protein